MKFSIYQSSRQGPRKYNQDRIAYSYSKDALLAVLADGMGGHRHGEVAAQLAIKTLTDAFQRSALPILANPAKFLNDYILQVHDLIESFAAEHDLADHPRTTIVAAIAQHDELHIAHVGDSRLYQFRNGKLIHRTEDHSKVQLMFRRGLINRAQMAVHPERNKIYNCLGGEVTPRVEIAPTLTLREGDTILLCSDGLWSLIGDEKMAEILSANPVTTAVPELLELAESRVDNTGDNMSAIAFNWGGVVSGKPAVSTATMALDAVTTIMMNPQPAPAQEQSHPEPVETPPELSDDEIESVIAEIQGAIKNLQKSTL